MIDLFAKYDVPAPRYTSYPDRSFLERNANYAAMAGAPDWRLRRPGRGMVTLFAPAFLRVALHFLRLQHGDHSRSSKGRKLSSIAIE